MTGLTGIDKKKQHDGINQQLGLSARRYDLDFPKVDPKSEQTPFQKTLQKTQRVAVMALPFLAFTPLGSVISIGMNTTRSISCIFETKKAWDKGNTKDLSIAAFQTAIAATSVAGSIFGNVYGMAISSSHDLLFSLYETLVCLQNGEKEKAAEKFLYVVSNSLYLTMILHSSLEIMVISFIAQILLEGFKAFNSQGSFSKYFNTAKDKRDFLDLLEGFAHLGMAGIRGYQMTPMVQMLVFKAKIEKTMKEQANKTSSQQSIVPKKQAEPTTAANHQPSKTATAGVAIGAAATAVVASGLIEEKNVTLVSSNNALCQAVERGNFNTVKDLVKDGADVNMRFYTWDEPEENNGNYISDTEPLIFLALPYPKILQFLIDSGANVHATHISGHGEYNILHKVIFDIAQHTHGSYEDSGLLLHDIIPIESFYSILKAGGPVNSVIGTWDYDGYNFMTGEKFKASYEGYTPLHIAAEEGCGACILGLLEYGANIEVLNDKGLKPYQIARFNEWGNLTEDTLEGFIKIGVDINNPRFLKDYLYKKSFPEDQELTKRVRAERQRLDDKITALIKEEKINIDARANGKTIFFRLSGSPYCQWEKTRLQWLLDRGADINARDDQGNSTLDIAKQNKNSEFIDWLLARGAK